MELKAAVRERWVAVSAKLYGRRCKWALYVMPGDLRQPMAHAMLAVSDHRIKEIERNQFLRYVAATADGIADRLSVELEAGGLDGYRVEWDDRPIP